MMRALIVCLALLLSACGFQLRGAYSLPFASLHVGLPAASEVGAGIKRSIRGAGGTRLTDTPQEAEATLVQTLDHREKTILSLSGTGRVREVRLHYRFGYRLVDRWGRELAPPALIELSRDMTFDDANVLSKDQEESVLWRDMQTDTVQQLMRRLTATKLAKLPPPEQ